MPQRHGSVRAHSEMKPLQVQLLGPGTLVHQCRPLHLHSGKAMALLAYLVIEADRPHARGKLAALLWPDVPEAAARQGLRQAMYSLRSMANGQLGGCLQADKTMMRWSADAAAMAAVEVDVSRFLAAVRSLDEQAWREAAGIPCLELLEGLSLAHCGEFAAWLSSARERLRALALHNLERLVCGCIARRDWDAAHSFAQALVALDPTSEAAFRHLCHILAARQQWQPLQAAWQHLCDRMRQDLDVAPSKQTAELVHTLCGHGGRAVQPQTGASLARPAADLPSVDEVDALARAGRAAERVYAFGQAVDMYDRALRVVVRLAESGGEGASAAAMRRQCELLLLKDAALERLGNRSAQIQTIEQALAVAAAMDDSSSTAALLLRRAGACAYLGRTEQASADAQQARQLYQALGDPPGEAEALRELGFAQWRALDYGAALDHAAQALQLHRQMGDIAAEASALHNLAEIQRGLGRFRLATAGYEQALQLHWSSGNRSGEILSLFGWAHTLVQAGDAPGALRQYRAALRLAESSSERTMQARALHALAMHHALHGEDELGMSLLLKAIEIDRAIGYAHALGHDLSDLCDLHLLRGERLQARAVLQEAMVWFGFTEEDQAIAACRQRLDDIDAGRPPAQPALQRWVKSHLALGEGKAYCEFETGHSRKGPAFPLAVT